MACPTGSFGRSNWRFTAVMLPFPRARSFLLSIDLAYVRLLNVKPIYWGCRITSVIGFSCITNGLFPTRTLLRPCQLYKEAFACFMLALTDTFGNNVSSLFRMHYWFYNDWSTDDWSRWLFVKETVDQGFVVKRTVGQKSFLDQSMWLYY